MKKILLGILITGMVLFSGCQSSEKEVIASGESDVVITSDSTSDDGEILTIGGEKINEDNARLLDLELGFGFITHEYFDEMGDKNKIGMTKLSDEGILIEYASQEMIDFLNELQGLPEEEISKRIVEYDKYAINLYSIFKVSVENDNDLLNEYQAVFSNVEELKEYDGYIYYLGYNTKFENINLTEEEEREVNQIISLKEEFKNNIAIYGDKLKVEEEKRRKEKQAKFNLGEFSVSTLDGEKIDSSFIKENKLTMINVWTTWCGPCVNEMPELSVLAREMLPKGVKILSVCFDGKEERDTAKEIIKDAGGGFTVVIPDDILEKSLMPYVDAYPTTLFVDSNGVLVGSKMVGAPYDDVSETYLNEINIRLDILNNK